MEGEGPTSSSRPPLPRPPSAEIDSSGEIDSMSSGAVVPVSSPLTYIVQVPKDHIYRVPPPENARLAEQYHAELSAQRRRRSPCFKFLHHVLCVAITVAIPLLIASLIFYIIVRPTKPVFYIHHLAAKYSPSAAVYDIAMEVKNPSLKMGYSIQKGDGRRPATLAYRGKNVARGVPPHFYLGAKETRMFKMTLRAAGKSSSESLKRSKKAVELRLAMEMPVRVAIGSLRLWEMKMIVGCDVEAKNLGKTTAVRSQECRAKVRP
ncbi:hypothetical protein KSP40_PGU019652 [Platanthera guangdongensis]|uniref:Late embryogenesis abundant protein LEA-2 subgroup domain-containing protein n=1 Tax=Platanthera guangdongensis TaxID=2320717 RepID=A0ABR2LIM9_9ASPA